MGSAELVSVNALTADTDRTTHGECGSQSQCELYSEDDMNYPV